MKITPIPHAMRMAPRGIGAIRQASITATQPVEARSRTAAPKEHGRKIFAYSHLQTKQVVYSLTKTLKNNHALSQLPFNGKKTVPRALRKDLWAPLASIEFPPTANSAHQGLLTFQKLREYRKLHETAWTPDFALGKDGKPLSRKTRGRKLMNQRANSVADMAAALKLTTGTNTEKGAESAKEKDGSKGTIQGSATAAPVIIKWADILDAEYAESWPAGVVHDKWETIWNNRRAPVEGDHKAAPSDSVVL